MSDSLELEKIAPLAEQIYAEATTLHKTSRHIISDASRLISWICYWDENRQDPEAIDAIRTLSESIQKTAAGIVTPTT